MNITITGGYGYRNAGDEAQLASNLSRWRRYSPGCTITILTPDPVYTNRLHGQKDTVISLATRIVWFNADKKADYFADNPQFRKKFEFISFWNRLAARVASSGFPIYLFLPPRMSRLHRVIQKSDVLFLSGGGYLTGSTASRLLDNMLLIQIAAIYSVPVLVSGQTFGHIEMADKQAWVLVRASMKIPFLVYTRDSDLSITAAREWGVPEERLFAGQDDALFSHSASLGEINKSSGSKLSRGKYIVLNVHYWGTTREQSGDTIRKIASVCDYIFDTYALPTVLLSMSPVDEVALSDVKAAMVSEASTVEVDYDPSLTRGLVANAMLCITMKHHPIIFSMGEQVPCMGFYTDEYYLHKNAGALALFGLDEYLVNVILCAEVDIKTMLDEILENHDQIVRNIGEQLDTCRQRDGEIIRRWLDTRKKNKT